MNPFFFAILDLSFFLSELLCQTSSSLSQDGSARLRREKEKEKGREQEECVGGGGGGGSRMYIHSQGEGGRRQELDNAQESPPAVTMSAKSGLDRTLGVTMPGSKQEEKARLTRPKKRCLSRWAFFLLRRACPKEWGVEEEEEEGWGMASARRHGRR